MGRFFRGLVDGFGGASLPGLGAVAPSAPRLQRNSSFPTEVVGKGMLAAAIDQLLNCGSDQALLGVLRQMLRGEGGGAAIDRKKPIIFQMSDISSSIKYISKQVLQARAEAEPGLQGLSGRVQVFDLLFNDSLVLHADGMVSDPKHSFRYTKSVVGNPDEAESYGVLKTGSRISEAFFVALTMARILKELGFQERIYVGALTDGGNRNAVRDFASEASREDPIHKKWLDFSEKRAAEALYSARQACKGSLEVGIFAFVTPADMHLLAGFAEAVGIRQSEVRTFAQVSVADTFTEFTQWVRG